MTKRVVSSSRGTGGGGAVDLYFLPDGVCSTSCFIAVTTAEGSSCCSTAAAADRSGFTSFIGTMGIAGAVTRNNI